AERPPRDGGGPEQVPRDPGRPGWAGDAAGRFPAGRGRGGPGVGDMTVVNFHRSPNEAPVAIGPLLDSSRAFVRRFVILGDIEADAVALWNAHTYVYRCAPATPYLHPYSPEPGSGKTTLLEVLALLARDAITADNLTEAVLFRMI